MDLTALAAMPISYIACLIVLFFLVLEACMSLRRVWAVPALMMYATTAAWYLVEPIYFVREFGLLDQAAVTSAFYQVLIFIVALRACFPVFARMFAPKGARSAQPASGFPAQRILTFVAMLWLILVLFGIYRMDGDIISALLPLNARAGVQMWQRAAAADAGSGAFLVSTASYLYSLVCASFGMLLPFLKRIQHKIFAYSLIVISWPYFLLGGSRNQFLAIFLPSIMSYLIFSNRRFLTKTVIGFALYIALDLWFRIVISVRNIGFRNIIENGISNNEIEAKHLGLNMASELVYINQFYEAGLLHITFGMTYLSELANVVPRQLWPGKPMIGIDYAILRGFAGGNSDIGVVATISTGFVGQGVISFGPIIGPVIAAIVVAAWAGLLARFRRQEHSILRRCLFLLGLGLSFNLGRDITLLVLWPVVFGYVIVRLIELRWPNKAPPLTSSAPNRVALRRIRPAPVRLSSRSGRLSDLGRSG